MSKKHYEKNKTMPHLPNVAQTKKGLNETLEVIRNAEEGTTLFNIYTSGVEIRHSFRTLYHYLKRNTNGCISDETILLCLGYELPDGRYSLVFDIPKELNVPMDEVVMRIFEVLPAYELLGHTNAEGTDVYVIPLSPKVVTAFKDIIVALDGYIKSWIKKNNAAVLKASLN